MVGSAETGQAGQEFKPNSELESEFGPELERLPHDERCLTEFDLLLTHRLPDGEYPDHIWADVFQNKKTAVQEGGIPHAVSTTEQAYESLPEGGGIIRWLGRTAIKNAQSGRRYHYHKSALDRVDVEIDEAHYFQEDLQPGIMKVLISPRMSPTDADLKVAKREHLADDDAVRTSWLETDEFGNIAHMKMKSLLVRYIPLQAWTDMLADPNNIFGKAISVQDPKSALSVMKAHRQLEIPLDSLPDGPVDILRAVVPYIRDEETRQKVDEQIEKFCCDQDQLAAEAEYQAGDWMKFDKELVDSYVYGEATPKIKQFIYNLRNEWTEDDLKIINNHALENGEFLMTRKLAVVLENAKINTLWTKAGVMTDNEEVISQLTPESVQQLKEYTYQARLGTLSPERLNYLEAQSNRLIAMQKVEVGGGCPGSNQAFGKNPLKMDPSGEAERMSNPNMQIDQDNNESGNSNAGLVRCPNTQCRQYVPKKDVVKATSWCCPVCKYEVDVCTGATLNPGNKVMQKPDFPEQYEVNVFGEDEKSKDKNDKQSASVLKI